MQSIQPIISSTDLLSIFNEDNLIIINAGGGAPAREAYKKNHLHRAIYVDLNDDLSDIGPDAAKGGRHPLPSPQAFGELLGRLGIVQESRVVVYDDKGGANAAARFWWMLRSIGHEKVHVLNGGIQAAERAGIPVDSESVEPTPAAAYPAATWKLPLTTIDEVEAAAASESSVVIDVRAAFRYKGESEPIDPIAGHIPGAINIPLTENLDENGEFLSPELLRKKYAPLLATGETTIHCGSGVTACHTNLALDTAGFEIPKLYVGSWSEWCRSGKLIGKEI
jgi:thiosulfate/3-mercaptopyruvate sulfurtransferase